MCVWQRVEQLPRTIEQLIGQAGVRPQLYLWNNNPSVAAEVDAAAARYRRWLPIEVRHSPVNVGGFGRFEYARALVDRSPTVIFIDDDQGLDSAAIATLHRESGPGRVVSWYAHRFLGTEDYWVRRRVGAGESAHYCGTGGMAVDTAIFRQPNFFDCPAEFRFVEDLWLSYYASHRLGWALAGSGAYLWIKPDNKDQGSLNNLHDTKTRFYRQLVASGWRIGEPKLTTPPGVEYH